MSAARRSNRLRTTIPVDAAERWRVPALHPVTERPFVLALKALALLHGDALHSLYVETLLKCLLAEGKEVFV